MVYYISFLYEKMYKYFKIFVVRLNRKLLRKLFIYNSIVIANFEL